MRSYCWFGSGYSRQDGRIRESIKWYWRKSETKQSIRVIISKYAIICRSPVSRVADMEFILLIAHLIRPPGSIPGVGWVRRNQPKQKPEVAVIHACKNCNVC